MFYKTILALLIVTTFGVSVTSQSSIHVGADICTECEQFVGTIHMVLANNETEASILAALKQVCGMLPSEFQTYCNEAVSTYGKQLIDGIVKYLADPSQICSLIGLCNGTMSQVEAFENLKHLSTVYANQLGDIKILPKNLIGISNCALCESVTSVIQEVFEDQPIEEFVQNELLKLCHLLPAAESTECLDVVKNLEPQMYMDFVKVYLNPATFCPAIGICPSI